MLPAEIRNFAKLLRVLGDPEQIKQITDTLDAKAAEVQTQLNALNDAQTEQVRRNAEADAKLDDATNKLALAQQLQAEAQAKSEETAKLRQEYENQKAALDDREVRLKAQQDMSAQQLMKLKHMQVDIDNGNAEIAAKQKELDSIIVAYNDKVTKLKAITE